MLDNIYNLNSANEQHLLRVDKALLQCRTRQTQ